MRGLARFLVVFLALRALLQPHDVCLCELSQALERSVARIFHVALPLAPSEHEDPRQGCVLCKVPAGVRGEHTPPPPRPAALLEPPPPAPETPPAAAEPLPGAPRPPPLPPGCGLYLCQCSLLI